MGRDFYIDGKPILATQNQVLMINSGQLHTGYSIDGSYCRTYAIVFEQKFIESCQNDACQQLLLPFTQGSCWLPSLIGTSTIWEREVNQQICRIIELYFIKFPGYQLGIKSAIYNVFFEIIRNKAFERRTDILGAKERKNIGRIETVLTYIHKHYNEKIFVEDLARMVDMCVHNFYRVFKSMTGSTPVEYINQYRINQAAYILMNENISITDVAFKTGFDNISYFIKIFKRYKQLTPLKFQKQYR